MGVSKAQLLKAVEMVKEYADDLNKDTGSVGASDLYDAFVNKELYSYRGFNYTTGCVLTPFVKTHLFNEPDLLAQISRKNPVFFAVTLDVSHTIVRGSDNVVIHNRDTRIIPFNQVGGTDATNVYAYRMPISVLTQNTTTNDYYVLGNVEMTFTLTNDRIDIIDYEVTAIASDAGNMNHEVGITVETYFVKPNAVISSDPGDRDDNVTGLG